MCTDHSVGLHHSQVNKRSGNHLHLQICMSPHSDRAESHMDLRHSGGDTGSMMLTDISLMKKQRKNATVTWTDSSMAD